MTSKHKLIIASAFLSLFALQSASANSIRCGTHIITAGDRDSPGQYEVLKRCGEPKARYGNTWIYQKGASSVTNVLRFSSDGQLYAIQKE